jgi:signal transduction histidine kinase
LGGSIVRLIRLLVAVPLIAVMGFAGLALQGSVQEVINAGTVYDLVRLSAQAGNLARALQSERVLAAVELTNQEQAASSTFDGQVGRTDIAVAQFQQGRADVTDTSPTLQRVDAGLTALTTVREQVRSSPRASLSAIAFSYRILIADLLAFRASVVADTPARIADEVRSAVAVSEAGEAIGQLQVSVLRSLAGGALTPAGQQESAAAQARIAEASTTFLGLAEPEWVARWEQIGTDPEVVAAQRMQDEVGRTLPGARFAVEPDEWVAATDGWISKLFEIQGGVDAAVADGVTEEREQRIYTAASQGAGMLLVLVLTGVLTAVVARRITRRLRSLRRTVTKVAYDRLPAVVRELDAAPPGSVRPDEVADRSVSEFRISGTDEIAEVATATRALHREAVRIAGEQAVMRANVAEIFVHLSRREQRLVDAMLVLVDQVERDEADPERLHQLYQLDHLATRMARINQSLLVLGGSGISRVRQDTVPLDHVIQAALSQIEHYTRVRTGVVDKELHVAGTAVDEIVHLLAELLDNATAYSAPETEVLVTGHALSDRAIVQVVDQGVGLSEQRCQQLNVRLASPGSVDVSGVRAMGLTVVARLAARQGVRVELRPGPERGTVAEIVMPASVIVRRPFQRPEPVEAVAGTIRPSVVQGRSVTAAGPAPYGQGALPAPTGVAASGSPAGRAAPVSPFAPAAVSAPAPLFQPVAGAPPERVNLAAPPDGASASTAGQPPTGGAASNGGQASTGTRQSDGVRQLDGAQPSGGRPVNGWFKTAQDGDSVTVTWPVDAGERWATAPTVAVPTPVGLPRRVPQHHLVPDAPQPAAEAPRKLDPSTVAAAMSAYAKGVASHRVPAGNQP